MELKNVTDKSVSKKLPDKEQVTLKPGDSYDFPDSPGYSNDPRLEVVGKKVEKVDKKVNELDLNKDGVVDKKDSSIAAKVLGSVKKKAKKKKK